MKSSQNFPLEGKVDVDETYVGGQDQEAIGRNEGSKKIVVVAIERREKGVFRMYAKVIETASKKNLKEFMQQYLDSQAEVRTDKWSGYHGLESEFRSSREKNRKRKAKILPCCIETL